MARATKRRGVITFTWEATQFRVSHYNLLVARSDRRINPAPITRAGDNEGAMVRYAYVAGDAQIRGVQRFELEMVFTNGASVRFPVSDAGGRR